MGEYSACYVMIYVWHMYFPQLAYSAINMLIYTERPGLAPKYGCWKDLKKLCEYVYVQTRNEKHEIITYCILNINNQLMEDIHAHSLGMEISNISKWIPRENSAYGWLFELCAVDWQKRCGTAFQYNNTTNDKHILHNREQKQLNHAKMEYRRIISKLNRHVLHTAEVYLCNGRELLEPKYVNKGGLIQHNNALLNAFHNKSPEYQKKAYDIYSYYETQLMATPSNGAPVYHNSKNSICASSNEKTFTPREYHGGSGFNADLGVFVKEAYSLLMKDKEILHNMQKNEISQIILSNEMKKYCDVKNRKDLLNIRWAHMCSHIKNLENVLPILDISWSMQEHEGEAWFNAVGWACLIACKSAFRGRIITVDYIPSWITFGEETNTLTKMVEHIMNYGKGNSVKCIDNTINMIANSFKETNIQKEDIEKIVLVLISDMKHEGLYKSLHTHIKETYNTAIKNTSSSIACINTLPHIVYLNIGRNTHALPSNLEESRVTWMCGTSCTLSEFIQQISSTPLMRAINPLQFICNNVNDKKYDIMDNIINDWLSEK
jgi:hypothetical protein